MTPITVILLLTLAMQVATLVIAIRKSSGGDGAVRHSCWPEPPRPRPTPPRRPGGGA